MTEPDCAKTRKAIETRNFVGWQGLPPDCSAGDLFDNIPGDFSELPKRSLGSSSRSAKFVLLELQGYYRPMASVRDSRLVLFDAMNPELEGGLTPLIEDLGEPAERLDWWYGTLEIPAGEWVFPSRGITVFVNTKATEALHVAVYAATSLEHYRSELRPQLRKRLRKK